jgi:hypothetical protein
VGVQLTRCCRWALHAGLNGALDDVCVFDNILPAFYLDARATYGLEASVVAIMEARVLGLTGGCRTDNSVEPNFHDSNCLFLLSGQVTPILLSSSPTLAKVGDTMTVQGLNFSPNPSDVLLFVNGVAVPTVTSSATTATFIVPEMGGTRGALRITLRVKGVGNAVGEVLFSSLFAVTAITPAIGSVGGGAMITIAGTGFSPIAGAMTVLLGSTTQGSNVSSSPCDVVSVTSTQIVCVTRESVAGVFAVTMDAAAPGTAPAFRGPVCPVASNCVFDFSVRRTPVIQGMAPIFGGAGTRLLIVGFGCVCSQRPLYGAPLGASSSVSSSTRCNRLVCGVAVLAAQVFKHGRTDQCASGRCELHNGWQRGRAGGVQHPGIVRRQPGRARAIQRAWIRCWRTSGC